MHLSYSKNYKRIYKKVLRAAKALNYHNRIEYHQVAHGFGKTFFRGRTNLLVILALLTLHGNNKCLEIVVQAYFVRFVRYFQKILMVFEKIT